MNETEDKNGELKINLQALKAHPGFKYLIENWTHWKNQCLGEILDGKGDMKEQLAKGEFKAYGRVINSIEFFIELLNSNPGVAPNLDPIPREKEKV